MEKIKIENLSFTYPTRKTPALDNINITVNTGEFITLCGSSGCGKTTLLKQLKPILSPFGEKNGKIFFDGRDISSLTQREQSENIGYVMQSPDNQLVCDKVWHELSFGLENLSCPDNEIRARVAEMATFFGIQDWYYKNVCELSGGQKQILNLASVMLMQPSVLLLDEPTSQLDPISAHNFLDTLSRINKELGTTIILSEHRLEEALPLSDRVIVMDDGKIIADGDIQAVSKLLYGQKHNMFSALPTPIRAYYSVQNDYAMPITVRDAREWLSEMPLDKDVKFSQKEVNTKNNLALKADNIFFRYEKNTPDILKGLSLEVYENELYAIVGANGAGKTTLLSVMADILTPYRGKIRIGNNKKVIALPQNPQNLFVNKTVLLELREIQASTKEIRNVIQFCELENLLDCHPYDLSGGEQQRLALAKVLLCDPDILLLDEPTKGLDSYFKQKLAKMLADLKKSGMTIIMVSHDIEFCAKYADRTALFFDGVIISEDTPRAFFSKNSFYTTTANRIARSIRKDAILDEDITAMLGTKAHPCEALENDYISLNVDLKGKEVHDKKIIAPTPLNIITGILSLIIFCIIQFVFIKSDYTSRDNILQALGIIIAGISLYNFIPKKKASEFNVRVQNHSKKLGKRTLISALIILLLIPLTIFIGIVYFGDRKYYFISMMIILEIMIPFMIIFEGRKPQARELVIISILCAISVCGRIAFSALPQFKPVIALVIISGVCFGGEVGFLVGAITAFVSNIYFMQGPWTPWQMFAYGISGFLAGVLFKKGIIRKSKVSLCIFGFITTVVLCGGILNLSSVVMSQEKITRDMVYTIMLSGLPLDVVHGMSTVFFLWFASQPLCEMLERVKTKYNI